MTVFSQVCGCEASAAHEPAAGGGGRTEPRGGPRPRAVVGGRRGGRLRQRDAPVPKAAAERPAEAATRGLHLVAQPRGGNRKVRPRHADGRRPRHRTAHLLVGRLHA
jgi:hypothetical protein